MSEVPGRGRSFPLGATVQGGGVNFSVFCKHATRVELLLFDSADAAIPSRVIELDPQKNRTFYYWHCLIEGIGAGQLYAYRAHGPSAPEQGMRFDGTKVLLDPYARAVTCVNYEREAAIRPGDNCARAMKGVVADPRSYDWEGDTPLCRPFAGSVIYELHVGGWTRNPNSGVAPERRGTYLGLIEKIPYLKDLGVTAVELLPVQHFDEQDAAPGRKNYWGYSPVALFAPHRGYCHGTDPLAPVREFCDLVKALHKAGIEVILDVVFNHTAEGGSGGPTLSFRGLANRGYYSLLPGDLARYADYSGCGNSLNANHSIVRRLIIDCLHYWVRMLHVDGFRFDLASVLARDANGMPLKDPPILWEIESDPVLAGTKLIAEAWDAAGLYQVGSFPGHRWAEWNGRYRDDVRRFVRGQEGLVPDLRSRIAGSRDIYPQPQREPSRSINFITCHDGFTLNDLCAYETKHNEDNGEQNRDGSNQNDSSNYGAEGPTHDPAIEAVRLRQIKNLLVILLLSQGTPMLLMGDEVRRTQRGNNNAYCQDNELGWFNWEDVEKNAGLLRFVRLLIRLHRDHRVFHAQTFWSEPQSAPGNSAQQEQHDSPQVIWHGVELYAPDLRPESHSLAFELMDPATSERLYVILNLYWEPLSFTLPALQKGQRLRRLIDTAQPSPQDACEPDEAPTVYESSYRAEARSAVVLAVC